MDYEGTLNLPPAVERRLYEVRLMAHHDTLTGLPNLILLIDRLEQAIVQSRRSGELLAVLFLDLDGFKPVNDTWPMGDERAA